MSEPVSISVFNFTLKLKTLKKLIWKAFSELSILTWLSTFTPCFCLVKGSTFSCRISTGRNFVFEFFLCLLQGFSNVFREIGKSFINVLYLRFLIILDNHTGTGETMCLISFFEYSYGIVIVLVSIYHIVPLTIRHQPFLGFWLVDTWFFVYPRDQSAATRLENVRQLNIRRGKKLSFQLSHT